MDKTFLKIAKQAALYGSDEILKVYNSKAFDIEEKSDNSPLTLADKAAHQAIVEELSKTDVPILSEEGRNIPFDSRNKWKSFWLVDPLDGTKEFIKRNGEFTVNIALIHEGEPILGVVVVPVTGDEFHAVKGMGAYKNNERISASKFNYLNKGLRVVASRSHMSPETEQFINDLNEPKLVSKGSSLKLLMIAEGQADLYPRYAPTMEWDTAAAQVIVTEAGGNVFKYGSKEIVTYNKESLLNPWFLVTGIEHT